jgi:uncharacterized membrane protein
VDYLVAILVTVAIHVPLNDAIKAAGSPDHIDVTQIRAQFQETRWAAWNLVRVITTTPAFGLLTWAWCAAAGRAGSRPAPEADP